MQSLSHFRSPPVSKSIGMELECILSADVSCPRRTYTGFFYITTDGSIECHYYENSIEFVSMPLTPQWLKKEIDKLWKKYPWTYNDSCGIHLHVSRKWLSEHKAKAIAKFLEDQQEGFFLDMFGRRPNEYCRRSFNINDRYRAINFTNTNTIEFRMFSSGNTPEWAKYCVDCVCYLIEHAYHLNVDACYAFRSLYNV